MSAKPDVATISDIIEVKSQEAFVTAVYAGKPLVVINAVSGVNNKDVNRTKERHTNTHTWKTECHFNTILTHYMFFLALTEEKYYDNSS